MYGIFHIRSVSVGLDSQIWYLFIYITGYLNVQKMSETMDFRTFVGSLINQKSKNMWTSSRAYYCLQYVIFICAKHFHRETGFRTKVVLKSILLYIVQRYKNFTIQSNSKLKRQIFNFRCFQWDCRSTFEQLVRERQGIRS